MCKQYTLMSLKSEKGLSLIEVLISVVVLSLGLLGMASLQLNALKNNQSTYQRTQAVMLTYFMLDAMRANRDGASKGEYDMPKQCSVPGSGGSLSANDKKFWMESVKKNVGNMDTTCAEISCVNMICTVRVFWNDERVATGATEQVFETTTGL
jgi:type IV pilus assembly protein PilV